jgi:hypothetical protein
VDGSDDRASTPRASPSRRPRQSPSAGRRRSRSRESTGATAGSGRHEICQDRPRPRAIRPGPRPRDRHPTPLPAADCVDERVHVGRRPGEHDHRIGALLAPLLPRRPRLADPGTLADVGVAQPIPLEARIDPPVR